MYDFHIHNTVELPAEGPRYDDVCKAVGAEPLVITNLIWGGISYTEYIPSTKYHGEIEMAILEAGRMLGKMSRFGFKSLRSKVEGTTHLPFHAHYYEAHLKFPWTDENYIKFRDANLPTSITTFHTDLIVTLRAVMLSDVKAKIRELKLDFQPKIEACYFDTNSALDERWINQ